MAVDQHLEDQYRQDAMSIVVGLPLNTESALRTLDIARQLVLWRPSGDAIQKPGRD